MFLSALAISAFAAVLTYFAYIGIALFYESGRGGGRYSGYLSAVAIIVPTMIAIYASHYINCSCENGPKGYNL